jgi:hypothetical protein
MRNRAQRRGIERTRTEVMKDRGAVIEHHLDVDQFPRPVPLLEDATAEQEAVRPHHLGAPRTGQVLRTGRAEHSRSLTRLL